MDNWIAVSILLLCKLTIMVEAVDYSDCTENIATLEHALYANGANVLQLNQVFSPPGSSPPRFVLVKYQFLNENNELDGCNVTYVWSATAYLIFQPPLVFRWTSLNFFYPDNELDELSIILPYECRGLVNNSTLSKNCTCDVENTALLDFLTQQMSVYTKFNNRENVIREETKARSICALNLGGSFYRKFINKVVLTTVLSTIILPVFGILLLLVSFKNTHDTTKSLVKPEGHATLAGMVMTGLVIVFVIFFHDILASYNVNNSLKNYRHQIGSTSTPNFLLIHVTLALDILFILSIMACLLYIIYSSIKQFLGTEKQILLPSRVMYFITLLIGKKNVINFRQLSENDIIAFVILYLFIPPLFMITSHIGYIATAWLIEPNKGAVIFFVIYLFTFYFYFAFKKCYELHSKFRISVHPPKSNKEAKSSSAKSEKDIIFAPMVIPPSGDEQAKVQDTQASIPDATATKSYKICGKVHIIHYNEVSNYINIQIFCLLPIYGIFITLFAAMMVSIVVLIPNASVSILTYIVNVFHVIVVLVTAQVSLKIFFAVSFDFNNFFNVFRNALSAKKETKANEDVIKVVRSDADTAEVAGVLAAEIADVMINKFTDREID